jgi:hypothetical protein
MWIIGKMSQRRARQALTTTLVLAFLAALLLAGAASAAGHESMGKSARPGTPTAEAPRGTTSTTRPTFTWSKAKGAVRYELRAYQGSKQKLKKTGITKLSWQSNRALPTNVSLTWKVRASNAAGVGAWSRSLSFKVVPPSSAKAITAFSFSSPAATGVINETLHTIALTVPSGTGVHALVPTITITGASVSPASGVARDFSDPVVYTVTAADATTQAYTVTVTVAPPLAIGDPYGGGKVAYILVDGDPGYSATVQHGLIAATEDQSLGIPWYNGSYVGTGATATALGTGFANTNTIIAVQGPVAISYAAGVARAYTGGGYADWYLPSQDELNKLYLNRMAIGGFGSVYGSAYYWSSSDFTEGTGNAWVQNFADGDQYGHDKSFTDKVRPVRSF